MASHNFHRTMSSSHSSHRTNHPRQPTISEYNSICAVNPPKRIPFSSAEIKQYVDAYVYYVKLAQDQNDAMADDPDEISKAYSRVETLRAVEEAQKKPLGECTYADVQATLADLAEKCKKPPSSFDDRVLLATYAMGYVTIMEDHIIHHPTRRTQDTLSIMEMAEKELDRLARDRSMLSCMRPFSKMPQKPAPPPAELIPAAFRSKAKPVTDRDLSRWKSNPLRLVGLGFINPSSNHQSMNKNGEFIVKDFVSTARGDRHFDVLFEDGEDRFPFGQEELLELIADTNYVRVEAALPNA